MLKLIHWSLKLTNKQGLKKYMWNTHPFYLSPLPLPLHKRPILLRIGSNLVNNWVSVFGEFFFIYTVFLTLMVLFWSRNWMRFTKNHLDLTYFHELEMYYCSVYLHQLTTLSTIGSYICLCHWLNLLNVLIHSQFYSYK